MQKINHATMLARFWIFMCSLSILTWSWAANSTQNPDKFDFEYFEHMKVDQKAAVQKYMHYFVAGTPASEAVNAAMSGAAQEYLNSKFPAGTFTENALKEVIEAGAKCGFEYQKMQDDMPSDHFYLCRYQRSGHGLMFFVETIVWTVTIFTDPDAKTIKAIWVGRSADGF